MKSTKFVYAMAMALSAALSTHSVTASADESDGWQLDRSKDDIRVYTREVAGSPFLAVKAVTTLELPVAQVSELMGDGEGCVEWRDMCKSSQVLETVSEHERYIYMVLDLPWPLSDRDLVIHSTTEFDPQNQSATIHLVSDSDRHPEQDLVRAETDGKFLLRVLAEGEVEFTYIMHTDLGGDAPVGVVNGRVAEAAFDDLERLRKLAEG